MRLTRRLLLPIAIGCLLTTAGCQLDEDLNDVVIPTQEQADAEASKTIDTSNADDEFEKLKADIEADIDSE